MITLDRIAAYLTAHGCYAITINRVTKTVYYNSPNACTGLYQFQDDLVVNVFDGERDLVHPNEAGIEAAIEEQWNEGSNECITFASI